MESVIRANKLHGLGNDFLVVLQSENPDAPMPGADEARRWCDRHRGIGADGLIVASTATAGDADVDMTLYNSDGSIAEISGNGIRCLAHALALDAGRNGEFVVDSGAGRRKLSVSDGSRPSERMVRVAMGSVTVRDERMPLPVDIAAHLGAADATYAEVGNPHLVVQVERLGDLDIAAIGHAVEEAHGSGINVHLAAVTEDGAVEVLHWERGVGVTEACGSGATVTAAVLARAGTVASPVTVQMPGGRAEVEVAEHAVLIGPSEYIARVEFADG